MLYSIFWHSIKFVNEDSAKLENEKLQHLFCVLEKRIIQNQTGIECLLWYVTTALNYQMHAAFYLYKEY